MRPIHRRLTALFLAAMFVFALPNAALAAPKPTAVAFDKTTLVIDLANGRTATLDAEVKPSGASQKMVWKSGDTSIATVSASGVITAKKTGNVLIGARPSGVSKWTKCKVKIIDSNKPTSIRLSRTSLSLGVGEEETLTATLLPSGSTQSVKWQSSNSKIARIDQDGTVTGVKAGRCQVRAVSTSNAKLKKAITVTVKKQTAAAPSLITITPDTKKMVVGGTLQLEAGVTPSAASDAVKWSSSNTSVATVSSTGLVKAKKAGRVKIAATSKVKPTVKTTRTIEVSEPNAVQGVEIDCDDLFLGTGDSYTLTATITPTTAQSSVSWKSSKTSVATVDQSGKLKAKAEGTATITATAGGKSASIKVTVLETSRTTEVPDRYTTTSGIKENLAKIDAIQLSAQSELNALYKTGKLTSSELSNRKKAIANAFAMYRFPWMTTKDQQYWNPSLNATNGFKTGRVYFGMPYIQTGPSNKYLNRQFNVTKAVSAGYFTKSSSYYLMNQSKKLDGMYVGNDCSSFVSMSIWGVSHAASYLNTTAMRTSSYYTTISGSQNLRPGDALVKSGVHTVMFLYFTNDTKTQMMIIENGGNTVSCSVRNVSSYLGNGYVIRRPNTFR